ncbi:hypothetical protein BB561_002478 [Smittium simulii]|uniref:J domain-containing protein n=1 Tax=Smittium simulii TaxID=133385 RepID=A0A2T9YQA7_9FUNG|nr:hypothetical protein BB561_002478 [Smittium simulii]
MVVNLEEAKRCLSIAKKKLQAGDAAAAERLAQKALNMHPLPEAQDFLKALSSAPKPSAQAQPDKKPAASVPKPPTESTPKAALSYTKEQVEAVTRIMSFKNDYYRVLELQKTASDSEIKKSYRKLALQFHPDKNKAPSADEAFKIVSQAFTTLSDSQKRGHYDQFGAATSPAKFSNTQFSQQPFAFTQTSDISPEDLFNAFFGQNVDGFDFNFGPGIRMRKFSQRQANNQRAQYYAHRPESNSEPDSRSQILSILIFFAFLLLSGLFTSVINSEESLPRFSFSPSGHYTTRKTTKSYNVDYFVKNSEFRSYKLPSNPALLRKLESRVISSYTNILRDECRSQMLRKERMIEDANGWLGIGRDPVALKKAKKLKLPSCDELARFT